MSKREVATIFGVVSDSRVFIHQYKNQYIKHICMYTYMRVYTCMCMYTYVYTYICRVSYVGLFSYHEGLFVYNTQQA